ncbi:ATP-binding protein [Aeoliella sp.]|uniref:ATP-binding protein n=1 Tax=Aeoliella sp. TaxID=2795800 RepID=UPI003CCB7BB6
MSPKAKSPSVHLQSFILKQGLVRDRVRSVAAGKATGTYLFGPPGTGKTHIARQTLEDLDVPYHYCNGHVTPMGLFDALGEHCDKVIVIDDVGGLFKESQAMNILMAATGRQRDGHRQIDYQRSGEHRRIYFDGGLVMLSNLTLHDKPLQQALKSRVHYTEFDPTQDEVEAFLRDYASRSEASIGMPQSEALEVLEFALQCCDEYSCRLDFRLMIDKSWPDYLLWKNGKTDSRWRTDSHWQDLVRTTIKERADEVSEQPLSKAEEMLLDRNTLETLASQGLAGKQLLAAWNEKRGQSHSQATMYRHLRAIKTEKVRK